MNQLKENGIERIPVIGIPFYVGSIQECARALLHSCVEGGHRLNGCISATGAHGLVNARQSKDFADILKSFVINLPDGMPVVWVGRLKGGAGMKRCYGPDFFAEMMRVTQNTRVRHFLCGGKEGVAQELQRACKEKFKNDNCVGTFSPPFRDLNDDELHRLAESINSTRPDIVWIGLSTPKQERFALELSKRINVHFVITVGAAFDFHTGRVRQAPHFVQKIGMEWFFRFMMEPRRLFPRYIRVVPLFLLYAALDFIFGRNKTNAHGGVDAG